VSELRSAVDSLRAEVLSALPDARVEEDFAELHRAIEQLEVSASAGSRSSIGEGSTPATGTCRPRRGSPRGSGRGSALPG
jgi:hypothetical protein